MHSSNFHYFTFDMDALRTVICCSSSSCLTFKGLYFKSKWLWFWGDSLKLTTFQNFSFINFLGPAEQSKLSHDCYKLYDVLTQLCNIRVHDSEP